MEIKEERNSFSEESHPSHSRSSSFELSSPGLPRKRRHGENESAQSGSDWSNISEEPVQETSKRFKTEEQASSRFIMLDKVIHMIKGINPKKLAFENVLPEFSPEQRTQTISKWLDKVDQCAEKYGWNEEEKVLFALDKLSGSAKVWYEECGRVLYKWSELRSTLEEEFRENYAELLASMLEVRVQRGESLVSYYFEKMGLLKCCDIEGRQAVDCLLDGIDDDAVRSGAHAARLDSPEHVIRYFQAVETTHSSRPIKRRSNRCYNCGIMGHKTYWCYKQKNKCSICSKWGHLDQFCWKADA